ncbi:MAG: ATP-binding protein [SAR324 cluster bacterium]|nr:ATP-binding protein [SAR324 cluster bacterium]
MADDKETTDTRSDTSLLLSSFKNLDFPVIVVGEDGGIMTASQGAQFLLPVLISGGVEDNFLNLLVDPPLNFLDWLHGCQESRAVRLRQPNGTIAGGVSIKALPVAGLPNAQSLWVLNLHQKESFSRQKYEREILLRIASVPISEMASEGIPLTSESPQQCPITRELLDMITKYVTGNAALLLRRENSRSLAVIGQCGFPGDDLARLLGRLEGGEMGNLNQGVLAEAAASGFTYSLLQGEPLEPALVELSGHLPFSVGEIWVDGISGFGAALTFFSEPPSNAARQFATDANVRLGRHLETAVYHNQMYEAYLALQQTQEQIIQSRKMAAIGELATGMAHELRQPVTAINNFITTIFDHLESGSIADLEHRLAEFRQRFKRNIDRLSRIIDHLRAFGRQEEIDMQPTEIEPFVREIFRTFLDTQLAGQNIHVNWDIADGLPVVEIDGPRVEQVILNLLSNARHAVEGIAKPVITIRGRCLDGRLQLSVCDNGPGIPEENLNKVTNPFFTTKAVGQGTGLGLSVSHGIVEGHHGNLLISNLPGGGACFTIDIPIKQPPVEQAPSRSAAGC